MKDAKVNVQDLFQRKLDPILAEYLTNCLEAFARISRDREERYGYVCVDYGRHPGVELKEDA